jgi:NAD(P)-dependent dehydrogenase (short-subunit alcohol dehydrogenase family)
VTATAVVTGAASGIGHACVVELAARGWDVVGWDLQAGADERVAWRKVDVGDYQSVSSAAAEVSTASLLINAAGVSDRAPVAEMTPDQWERVLRVDLTGVFFCCRALFKPLVAGKGTVVNIASIAGHRSFAQRANYCAAKAGVLALTEVLGLEWAAHGVRVVAVSPGFVATPMMVAGIEAGFLDNDQVLARTPQRRLASPEEIARSIIALAGEPFDYLTGTTVVIDGGWCANGGF